MGRDLTTRTLGQRIASARNYAYEATMNDYSMSSIRAAEDALAALREEAGPLFESLASWDPAVGHWKANDAPRST